MHAPPSLPILSVGCLAGFMLKDMSGIQGFVAGGFIYIATVDIIPVMLQDSGFGWPLIFEILAMTRQSPLSPIPFFRNGRFCRAFSHNTVAALSNHDSGHRGRRASAGHYRCKAFF
jgi:hypothetical protein